MLSELSESQLTAIRECGEPIAYPPGERIFSEGDEADYIYFVSDGRVSVFIEKFATRVEIQSVGKGEWLGEMAAYHNNRRTASAAALEGAQLIRIPAERFLQLMASDSGLAGHIRNTLLRRREELVSREKLLDLNGGCGPEGHIGIKGDPSLRESALTRERYESIVDRLMPELVKVFKALLLERSAYRLFIGFNSGEINISTVHDPFGQEYHPASRLVDPAYLERHFPRMAYAEKERMIRTLHEAVTNTSGFVRLPEHLYNGLRKHLASWGPVPAAAIEETLDKLPLLRAIPHFYVRNATIGITTDAIHLQFNCDGGHILSTAGYRRFVEENV